MRIMNRRTFLFAATPCVALPSFGYAQTEDSLEELSGNPEDPPVVLRYSSNLVEAFTKIRSATTRKDSRIVAETALSITLEYAAQDVSRTLNNGAQVAEFLELFGLPLRYPGESGSVGPYVPYCAAGVSYATCLAYARTVPQELLGSTKEVRIRKMRSILPAIREHYYRPSPSVRIIVTQAKADGKWVPVSSVKNTPPKPGWLVIFSWAKNDQPNHIGFVESYQGERLRTAEYNTSKDNFGSQRDGGRVSRRTRGFESVLGFVATW